MRDRRLSRAATGLVVGLVLIGSWPMLSALWIGALKAVVLPLARPGTYGPTVASPVLALVVAVLLGLDRGLGSRARLAAAAFATTLGIEAVLVILGAVLGAPADLMGIAGSVVQNAIPVAWLAVALRPRTGTAS